MKSNSEQLLVKSESTIVELLGGSEDSEDGPEEGQSEVDDSWLGSEDGLSLDPLEVTVGTVKSDSSNASYKINDKE